MLELLRRSVGGGVVRVVCTERSDGDVHPRRVRPDLLRRRQEAITGRPWIMVDQVHGRDPVERRCADGEAAHPVIGVGDVLIGDGSEPVAIWAADCAAIVLFDDVGGVVACHAGWRGLAAGVIDVAVALTRPPVAAVLGPCIHPCCYEFGRHDLAKVASGCRVATERNTASSSSGAVSLDVPATVALALDAHGIGLDVVGPCTGCDDRWFSHRRGDAERHAVVVWNEHAR
jgi:copper oxidase (laccase) domain-containing protein